MTEQAVPSKDINELLNTLASTTLASIQSWEDVVFIGIRSGGVLVAKKVVDLLEERTGKGIPLGALDIALYRDDLSKMRFYPEVRKTDIPFSVDDKTVILVDDVLHTGRSVRAAIDHIVDLGRPMRIYLMVLFDRGGREFPIQADFVGKRVELSDEKIIKIEAARDAGSAIEVIICEVSR
ncbi:MAG TPA: bifunctional pyr operon transcriptional regulator/uracil phosphoribosyltransferase PyrR [Deltaproteobacteria bacterium]|nr:bifunctional pyr operon transcriptional regulator/uracil phosphoribosyltransferase PyrR [Deltaproteobacteria bacterium]